MTDSEKSGWYKGTHFIFLAAAIVLLVMSILSYQRFQNQKASSGMVNHTYLVKLKLEEVYGSLRDAEARQRGYLLTGDSLSLQYYLINLSKIPQTVAELETLVTNNPQQKENLKAFAGLVQRHIRSLDMMIDSAQYLNVDELNAMLMEGRSVAEATRVHIGRMQQLEDEMLNRRILENEAQERKASRNILIFSFCSLLALVYAYFRLRTESALRSQSEYNATVLEQKVQERTAEIQQMNLKLHDQYKELERKNEELTSFTYIASHDLKEPLRKIASFADRIILSEQQLSANGKRFLERIIASITRMYGLIDSVYLYVRTESEVKYELVNLAQVAKAAVNNLQEEIEEKEATVSFAKLPVLYAVPEQMGQLFYNLISNALKYSKPDVKPCIEVGAEMQKPDAGAGDAVDVVWKLTFSDNGIGFNEQYKDKIFKIFQRLHGMDEYSGTGIGLAICKKIAENHHGNITATSTVGQGSVFTVWLPFKPHNGAGVVRQ